MTTENNKIDRLYNFSVNTSNQANLSNAENKNLTQINSVFIVVSPYYIDDFNIDGLDLDIKITEEGNFKIDGEEFVSNEIKPGVRVFGVSKNSSTKKEDCD